MAEKLDPKEIVTPWPSSYMTPRLHWATASPIPLRDGTLSGQPRSRHGCRHPSLPESQPRRWIFVTVRRHSLSSGPPPGVPDLTPILGAPTRENEQVGFGVPTGGLLEPSEITFRPYGSRNRNPQLLTDNNAIAF